MGRLGIVLRAGAKAVAWTMALTTLLIGYGLGADDARRLGAFCTGVGRWQSGPEFRRVSHEYVTLSHAAMNARPWGVPATRLMMGLRSIPGLPPEYAVNPTSQAHYDDFTRGELSAYLHLCGEQTMDWVIGNLHYIAQRGSTDADVEAFLKSWKMNRPVACDADAVAGVKRLISEIDAAEPLERKMHVAPELEAAASGLAARLGYDNDLRKLNGQQQHVVFEQLDADVHQHNPELWRYKQVSDMCSGIWAQTFGVDYTMVIEPAMTTRNVARTVGPVMAIGLIFSRGRNRERPATCP